MDGEREKGAAGEWFAEQLGEGWRTTGNGIYEYVGERVNHLRASQSSEPDPKDEIPPTQIRDATQPIASRRASSTR
jgi:hypothetical protein